MFDPRLVARVALAASTLAFSCAGAKPELPYRGALGGPAGAVPVGPVPATAADRALARLAERFVDASLQLDPVYGSYVGYRKWDHLLPDWSKAGVERSVLTLRALRAELQRIPEGALSPAYAIDRAILLARADEQLFTLEVLRPYEWDVLAYNDAIGSGLYYLTIPPEDPARWPERLEAILGRLAALPAFLETAKGNLAHPPRVFTELAIKQHPANLETVESQLPALFAPYPAMAARFEAAKPRALAALRDFQATLEGELLARSSGDHRLGKERWERKLALALHASAAPDELYRDAERRLDATRFEMYDLALPLFRATWPDDQSYRGLAGDERINHVVGAVLARAANEHGSAESIFADVDRYAREIKAFLVASRLITLPPEDDRFAIEPTPAFLDGLAVAFFNPAPAFEPNLKKSFWISSVPKPGTPDAESYLREYNAHTLRALTIHEAFPGHYVQSYWSQRSPYASLVKRVYESGTMAEGWAVAIEELLHEHGYAKDDPHTRLFHLKMRLRVFTNAMIDHRIHTAAGEEGDVDRWALELMMKRGFQEEAEATRKLRRAKVTSTQLSTYFVGYNQIRAIYDGARRKAGPAFEPKGTLEKILSYGTIPPPLIEKMMRAEGAL